MTRRSREPVARLLSPLREFLATEAAGAVLVAFGAVAALVWANSPWSASYEGLWTTPARVGIAGRSLDLDVRHWINNGCMTLFFLVVGLEIKRELVAGHLATKRAAVLPAAAALGGMVVPALVYLAIAGTAAPRGWAIPVATDIALAVGVLAVVGSRVPPSLRAFLLGLAIVDDIGAIVIIAAVYSTGLRFGWIAVAAAAGVATVGSRRCGVRSIWLYVGCGIVMWFGLHHSGVHPTLAGVVLGLLVPARSRTPGGGSFPMTERLERLMHPWTSYLVVPLFALANSGIEVSVSRFRDAAGSRITWGVLLGLLFGKPVGIVVATALAVRSNGADMPLGAEPRQLVGIATAAGIGFTVALFITELAFTDPVDRSNAKIAILVASVLAAGLSTVILRGATSLRR